MKLHADTGDWDETYCSGEGQEDDGDNSRSRLKNRSTPVMQNCEPIQVIRLSSVTVAVDSDSDDSDFDIFENAPNGANSMSLMGGGRGNGQVVRDYFPSTLAYSGAALAPKVSASTVARGKETLHGREISVACVPAEGGQHIYTIPAILLLMLLLLLLLLLLRTLCLSFRTRYGHLLLLYTLADRLTAPCCLP